MIHTFLKSDFFKRFHSKLSSCFPVDPTIDQRKLHVFQRGKICDQIKALKDKTNLLISYHREIIILHCGYICSIQIIFPGGGDIQTAQHVHKGGFSGTGLSDNSHKFTLMDLQVHMIQRPHLIFSGIVNLAQIYYPYQCIFHNKITPCKVNQSQASPSSAYCFLPLKQRASLIRLKIQSEVCRGYCCFSSERSKPKQQQADCSVISGKTPLIDL